MVEDIVEIGEELVENWLRMVINGRMLNANN
jgi:hypothetical protein